MGPQEWPSPSHRFVLALSSFGRTVSLGETGAMFQEALNTVTCSSVFAINDVKLKCAETFKCHGSTQSPDGYLHKEIFNKYPQSQPDSQQTQVWTKRHENDFKVLNVPGCRPHFTTKRLWDMGNIRKSFICDHRIGWWHSHWRQDHQPGGLGQGRDVNKKRLWFWRFNYAGYAMWFEWKTIEYKDNCCVASRSISLSSKVDWIYVTKTTRKGNLRWYGTMWVRNSPIHRSITTRAASALEKVCMTRLASILSSDGKLECVACQMSAISLISSFT